MSTQGEAAEAGGIEAVTSGFFEIGPTVSCKDPFGRYKCAADACSTASQVASVRRMPYMFQSIIACKSS